MRAVPQGDAPGERQAHRVYMGVLEVPHAGGDEACRKAVTRLFVSGAKSRARMTLRSCSMGLLCVCIGSGAPRAGRGSARRRGCNEYGRVVYLVYSLALHRTRVLTRVEEEQVRLAYTQGETVFVTLMVDSHLVQRPRRLKQALHLELELAIDDLLKEVQRDQTTTAEVGEEASEAGTPTRDETGS